MQQRVVCRLSTSFVPPSSHQSFPSAAISCVLKIRRDRLRRIQAEYRNSKMSTLTRFVCLKVDRIRGRMSQYNISYLYTKTRHYLTTVKTSTQTVILFRRYKIGHDLPHIPDDGASSTTTTSSTCTDSQCTRAFFPPAFRFRGADDYSLVQAPTWW